MNLQTIAFARSLEGAVPFAETIQGRRQSRAWERLVSYIASSDSPSDFDRASAFAEGYAQALVDGEQIEISIERDLLIISIVDEWRRHFTAQMVRPPLALPSSKDIHDFKISTLRGRQNFRSKPQNASSNFGDQH